MASLFKKKKIPKMTKAEFLEAVERIRQMDDKIHHESNLRQTRRMLDKLKKALEVK
tara:strand:- start:293 stop:460 length:168 start_codon:yes stop_codon:yes gene_type:complete